MGDTPTQIANSQGQDRPGHHPPAKLWATLIQTREIRLFKIIGLLFLASLPSAVEAQFNYITNGGTITITGYTGLESAVAIPETIDDLAVTGIGDHAFDGNTIVTSVIIPRSVTSIGGQAFNLCNGLTSITIPDSVTNIGSLAFASLKLQAITVDTNNFFYSSLGGVLFNKRRTTLLEYPEGKSDAFYSIPNGVTNIGFAAFYGANLTEVTIPDSVISIGTWAFMGADLFSVNIGNGVTSIGVKAFAGCRNLSSVAISKSVNEIKGDAFFLCESLWSITVDPASASYSSLDGVLFDKPLSTLLQYPQGRFGIYTIPSSVTNIAPYAFFHCGLTSVVIGNNVITIGAGAFDSCRYLQNITIPNSVTIIPENLFSLCTSLTNVTIGTEVTAIGVSAFSSCSKLTKITIPNSVAIIGNGAFNGCSSLASVTIGKGVTSILAQAFSNCSALKSVYFSGNAPRADLTIFQRATNATAYYWPGTTGWTATFAGRPTALWTLPNPLILNDSPSFGIKGKGFGFPIFWATNVTVVVEASTGPPNTGWSSVSTNVITNGSSYFHDPLWTNYPTRVYRVRLH